MNTSEYVFRGFVESLRPKTIKDREFFYTDQNRRNWNKSVDLFDPWIEVVWSKS